LSAAVAFLVLATACSTGSAAPKEGERVELDGQSVVNHGTIDVGGQTAEDVQAQNNYFDPTVLTGSGGETITLSIDNSTDTLHNFSLQEQQIDQDVPPGQSVKVTVTFPANGRLVFFCKYHRARGMLGELLAG
jgi:plastocyanin